MKYTAAAVRSSGAWKGNYLLHLVTGATPDRLLIGNNLGKTKGWVPRSVPRG